MATEENTQDLQNKVQQKESSKEDALTTKMFPHFTPLLNSCQSYAQESGNRFRLVDFERKIRDCSEAVEEFRRRLIDENEKGLIQEFHMADKFCNNEVFLRSMQKTLESLDLWHPNPKYDEFCVHWQDMDQSIEAIAAQLYNYYKIRPVSNGDVLTASFIADFGYAYGMEEIQGARNLKEKTKAFMDKATKYAKRNDKRIETSGLSKEFKKWVQKNQDDIIMYGAMGILAAGFAALAMRSKRQ